VRGEKRWQQASPHCRDPAYVFEMWSQAKQVTEPQRGQRVFYSSPKYNLKLPNAGTFC